MDTTLSHHFTGHAPLAAVAPLVLPEPERVQKAVRRGFTQEYKLSVIAQADACADRGWLGALLRREGLYDIVKL